MRVLLVMSITLLTSTGCPSAPSGECQPCECQCPQSAAAVPSQTPATDAAPATPQKRARFEFLGIPHRFEQTKEYRDACPLVPVEAKARINSAGTSELSFEVLNQGSKTVDSFDFVARCFNNYDEHVVAEDLIRELRFRSMTLAEFQRRNRLSGDDVRRHEDFRGRSTDKITPRQRRSLGDWSMFDFDGATQAIVTITKVHFADNALWEGEVTQEVDPR